MSLSKQLVFLISIMFLAIFSVNFYASITNIRNYLQIESEVHAQDTATSLGLSLSPYILDEDTSIMETMINAIFDRGYYLAISLENRHGEALVEKNNPKTFEDVPEWFIKILPMKTAMAQSEIDAGWVKGGIIYVTIHPGMGYLKLWQQAKQTFIYSILMLAVSIGLLAVILQLVLKPLARIDKLALSIADGNFDTIEELPWTTEIRNIARSMNFMSGKIENIIGNLHERLEETGKRLRVDELTGLETKGTLETEMKQRFMSGSAGFVFLIRIADLGGLAKTRSSAKVDGFIRQFVKTIKRVLQQEGYSEEFFYRIVGAEFVLIADCSEPEHAHNLCKKMMEALSQLGEENEKPEVAHIGGVAFDPQGTISSMLSAAMEAYEKACLISANAYTISEDSGNARDKDQWLEIVTETIDQNRVKLDFGAKAYSLAPGEEDRLVLEEAIAKVYDSDGEEMPIGTFISVAEKLNRIIAFDLGIINRVIDYLKKESIQHDVAVNLSFASLASNDFRAKLFELLNQNRDIRNRLVFCVTAYGAAKDLGSFASFIDLVHRNDSKIILKRFESRFISINDIKQFKLDYIRLASIYTENISTDHEKQQLVKAMSELGTILDITVLAEGVISDADYSVVKEIGLTAVSR